MAEEEKKVVVIDDSDREAQAESLCKWAAARAGVIVVAPGLGTMSLLANDIYMIMKLGGVFEEKIGEKAALSLLGSCGTVFVGGRLATLIPFAPLQIPIAVATTYGLGRVVTQWLKDGKPKDLSTFKKVYEDAVADAKAHMENFRSNPDKDKPLGDESKKFENAANAGKEEPAEAEPVEEAPKAEAAAEPEAAPAAKDAPETEGTAPDAAPKAETGK